MNNDFQSLRRSLVSGALVLSLMLTGCSGDKDNSKKIYVGDMNNDSAITYVGDNHDIVSGTIPADKVDKYIKIVTFKRDDFIFTKLVAITDCISYGGRFSPYYRAIEYTDLDSSTTLISYKNYDTSGETTDHISYSTGENLEIVSVIDFMPYLYKEGKFADQYEINDLLNFYHEKVESIFEDTDKIILG